MEKMKAVQFLEASDAEWRKAARKSLYGRSYDELKTETLEGIQLEPLYTKESAEAYFGGLEDTFVTQVRQGMPEPGWIIAQRSYEKTSESFL